MRLTRLFFVHLSAASRPVSLAAGRAAFPEAEVIEAGTVEEAAQREGACHPELLVLAEPDHASVAGAVQAVDASGRPRWAVVILGRNFTELAETVPPEEWNPPLLARAFRSAVLQHELLHENLRLRGDLRTVAYRFSHDFYTPVGCIFTSAHVLELLPPTETSSFAAMIDNIKESSKEASRLVERICFVLRASADPTGPNLIDMHVVVAAVLKQLEEGIKRNGVTVTEASTWPEVHGVAPWLHVIWWNLLDNAVKHGSPGSEVRVAWSPAEDGYRFSVINPGNGAAPPVSIGPLRPFDQLHGLRAPGLGLAIVQRLVALQGGRCAYGRLADGSSEFSFTLPAGLAETTERMRDQPAQPVRTRPPRPGKTPGSSAPPTAGITERSRRPLPSVTDGATSGCIAS
jgi:signal transduction histidine kinase